MHNIDINCDVGEGVGNEQELMPFIQSCNIACGGHAGNESLMQEIVMLAIKYKVNIGAHPSYPDIENFGRVSIKIGRNELAESLLKQIDTLHRIIVNCDGKLNHIKAHGALYNDLMTNEELSYQYINIIGAYKNDVILYLPEKSVIARIAVKNGFRVVYEAFADRNYMDDLGLVSRKEKNAVISDPNIVLDHVLDMKNKGVVTTITGNKLPIKATTFCVHSDTNNAVDLVKYLNKEFNQKS